jgi:hypothetical protein
MNNISVPYCRSQVFKMSYALNDLLAILVLRFYLVLLLLTDKSSDKPNL